MTQLVWLVTGCSTGFGVEFVKGILKRGDKAIATARNFDSLKELASLGAATLQFDVSAPMSELQGKVNEAIKIYGHIDVLVANAGYVQMSVVEELGDQLLKQMQTNTFGHINMVTAIMPHWRQRKSGFLVSNSSCMSWWSDLPGIGAYAASKAALDRLVTMFTAEVADLGYIKTLIINPGHHRTQTTNPEKHNLGRKSENYQGTYDMLAGAIAGLHGNQPGDASKAANLTIDLVRGEGVAKGRKLPPFMPMGTDAYTDIKANAEMNLKLLEEWGDVIKSTGFEVA